MSPFNFVANRTDQSLHLRTIAPQHGGRHAQQPVTDVSASRMPRFGLVGSVRSDLDDAAPQRCWDLGAFIASAGCDLLTRACAGLTHAAVLGARSAGGRVIGISPAASLEEHAQTLGAPWRDYDLLIFTGPGTAMHELIHLRSSDVIVLAGGAELTLDELALACAEGKLIGILGSARCQTELPEEAAFIRDDDPERLVARLLWQFASRIPIAASSDPTVRSTEVQP